MSLKVLHRIYFGFDGKPDPYLGYLRTWSEQLPEYEIRHWNVDNLPIDSCYYSRLMFELKDHAFLSDYFRWWILREYGGIYLDADIEIVNGRLLNELISNLENSTAEHALIGIDNKAGGWYTGHSMASKKGGDLAQFMCEVYEGLGLVSLWRRKIFYFMAPQLTSLYFTHRGWNPDGMGSSPNLEEIVTRFGVKIFPQEYFSPLTPSQIDGVPGFTIDAYTKNTCICHHFSCSWHDADSPYKKASKALQNNPGIAQLALEQDKKNGVIETNWLRRHKIFRIINQLLQLAIKFPKHLANIVRNS